MVASEAWIHIVQIPCLLMLMKQIDILSMPICSLIWCKYCLYFVMLKYNTTKYDYNLILQLPYSLLVSEPFHAFVIF